MVKEGVHLYAYTPAAKDISPLFVRIIRRTSVWTREGEVLLSAVHWDSAREQSALEMPTTVTEKLSANTGVNPRAYGGELEIVKQLLLS